MSDNTIIINKYLLDEMDSQERNDFEIQLQSDSGLREELLIQKQIINATITAGIKESFGKAIKKRKTIYHLKQCAAIILIGCFVVAFFNYDNKVNLTLTADTYKDSLLPRVKTAFIQPPLKNVDVPYQDYYFEAQKGTTIFHSTGSILYFPPSSLNDSAGNPIIGNVKVTYREFSKPIDFFLSGIPMDYDSAGKEYRFESAGMCELNAFQNNKPVFVNKNAMPEIHLSVTNKSTWHNLYYLDTIARSWIPKGKDHITDLNTLHTAYNAIPTSNEIVSLPTKPIKPTKASINLPSFSIEIDSGSFEELFVYDKLKFEVVDDSKYSASDANEHWNNVQLDKSKDEGIYQVTFTNHNRKVKYTVRPVLEEEDYATALKIFNQKNKAYEAALQKRVAKHKAYSDSIATLQKQMDVKFNTANSWNNKLDQLLQLRKQKFGEMINRTNANQSTGETPQLKKENLVHKANMEIMRSFNINHFGVWNCDHPEYPQNEIPIAAQFKDEEKNTLQLSSITVVYKNFNGICQFDNPGSIRLIPSSETMLWTVHDNSFYYFTYYDYQLAKISKDSKDFVFTLRKTEQPITSYQEIMKLTANL